MLARGDVSSVELTRACLQRIEQLDATINAFMTVLADEAVAEAQRADEEQRAGRRRGPLHGIPIAHKDLYDTAGVRTTAGSKLFENRVPDHDATVVRKLKEAGTVLLGKLNLHELA